MKMIKSPKAYLSGASISVLSACGLLFYNPSQAAEYNFDFNNDEVTIDVTHQVQYGLQWRTQDPSTENTVPRISEESIFVNPDKYLYEMAQSGRIANGNDGNLNMGSGLVSNRASWLGEMDIRYKDVGAFVRGRYWYDNVYRDDPDTWTPTTTAPGFPPTAYPAGDFNGDRMGRFQDETQDYLGNEFEFLDVYVYGYFDVLGMPSNLKVGKQVINWGESLAFPNSISSGINPVDANAGTRAGIELKEIYLPTEAVYGSIGLTDKITLEAYYQWKHRGIEVIPAGSFWSEQDMLGAGGDRMVITSQGFFDRDDRTDDVSDTGQYGLALRYLTDSGTEYGLYSLTYHNKAPSLLVDQTTRTYITDYKEDIRLHGASVSTVLGTTNVSGEISYRPNAIVVLDPTCVDNPFVPTLNCTEHLPSEPVRGELTQAQISFVHILSTTPVWDDLTLSGELMGWRYGAVNHADNSDPDSFYVTNTPDGAGLLLRADFGYYNVQPGLDVTVPVTWQYGLDGTNLSSNSREDASVFSIGAKAKVNNNFETSLVYTRYEGEDEDQFDPNFYHLHDRDNIALSVKYNF